MGLIINKPDFVGKYKIGGTNFDAVDKYIDRYEVKFLKELLGVELFGLFKIAYDADPTLVPTPIYKAIFDPISEDNDTGCEPKVIQNNGMKQMLIGLIWFEFVRDLTIKMTNAGPKNDEAEVSNSADLNFMYQYYNEAVHDWQTIQWFINKNEADYPTFNGETLTIAHWAL